MENEKVRFTTYVPKVLKDEVLELSNRTRVPQSRLFEEAVEDLLKKYRDSESRTTTEKK